MIGISTLKAISTEAVERNILPIAVSGAFSDVPPSISRPLVNRRDPETHIPVLVEAVAAGNMSAAEQLLKAGADPNATDYQPPKRRPTCAFDTQLARSELGKRNQRTALIEAAEGGYYETVTKLLENEQLDVNKTDSKGFSAIMKAYKAGHHDIVQQLFHDRRANFNIRATYGDSLLMLAITNKDHTFLKLLFSEPDRINPNISGNAVDSHQRPLNLAIHMKDSVTSGILLAHPQIIPSPSIARYSYGDQPPLQKAFLEAPEIAKQITVHHKTDFKEIEALNNQISSPVLEGLYKELLIIKQKEMEHTSSVTSYGLQVDLHISDPGAAVTQSTAALSEQSTGSLSSSASTANLTSQPQPLLHPLLHR